MKGIIPAMLFALAALSSVLWAMRRYAAKQNAKQADKYLRFEEAVKSFKVRLLDMRPDTDKETFKAYHKEYEELRKQYQGVQYLHVLGVLQGIMESKLYDRNKTII